MVHSSTKVPQFICTLAGCSLQLQEWDDVIIVYQPSSGETHVFNETTASILRCLERGPLSAEQLKKRTEAALGAAPDELAGDDFTFATMRLEELGLIECLDDACAVQ